MLAFNHGHAGVATLHIYVRLSNLRNTVFPSRDNDSVGKDIIPQLKVFIEWRPEVVKVRVRRWFSGRENPGKESTTKKSAASYLRP